MKVVLVFPFLNHHDPVAPMGIISLGTVLKRENIDVTLIDLSFSTSLDEYKESIKRLMPDIVGISTMSLIIDTAFEVAKLTKILRPQCKVVFGGAHATALPEETLTNEFVDVVVIGEGEYTLLDLVRTWENGGNLSEVRGIYYKDDGQIKVTQPRPFIENLDDLPIPDRDLLPTFRQHLEIPPAFPRTAPFANMFTSRGCPFNCAFCQPMLRKEFGKKIRCRSADSVVNEMELLIDRYNVKTIYFNDDTFLTNKKRAVEICEKIRKRGINNKIVWTIQTNVNTIDEDIATVLKRSGCIYISFGVESGNNYILQQVLRKNQTVGRIKKSFEICHKVGLLTGASLIIGSPGDTKDTIRDTVKLVEQIKPDSIDTHFLTPTPGSDLYDKYLEMGILDYKQWADPDRYTPGLIKFKGLTEKDLISLYEEVQQAYFKGKSMFRVNPLWLRWLWNGRRHYSHPIDLAKWFLIEFLMRNDIRWYRFVKWLSAFKRAHFSKSREKSL